MWTPDKILDRHLDLYSLREARKARKILSGITETKASAVSREKGFYKKFRTVLKTRHLLKIR